VCRLTSRRSQPPLALFVPLSRFTSRVGGGSALVVRHQDARHMKITFTILAIGVVIFLFGCTTNHTALSSETTSYAVTNHTMIIREPVLIKDNQVFVYRWDAQKRVWKTVAVTNAVPPTTIN
jgi:hypothetical protein